MNLSYKKILLLIIFVIFLIIFDRFFKILSKKFFFNNKIEIIGDFLKFNFAKNYFIAFSIPISGYILNILIILIILLLLILLIYFIQKKQSISSIYLFFIILGASSNLFDRIYYGYVIDYFDLKYFTIFNLADCLIVFGSIGLLLTMNKKNKFKN